jgi:DNA-binding MarR family transcriptional regulator
MKERSSTSGPLFPGITQTLRVAPITLEHKILLWLLRYPFQRAEDLARALETSVSTTRRHLVRQAEAGLVEYITPPRGLGNSVRCYYLTQQGLVAAALQERSTPAELAQRWHADERGLLRLLPRLHQVLLLQDIVNSLVISSAQALAHPGGIPAAISWHWRRAYQHRFVSHNRTWLCRADGALVLQRLPHPHLATSSEGCYSLLLVVEGLIELDYKLIRQQLDGLLRYRESRERIPFYQSFPPLLVVVHQPHQRALWQRCAIEVAMARRVKPLIGAVASVPMPLAGFPAASADRGAAGRDHATLCLDRTGDGSEQGASGAWSVEPTRSATLDAAQSTPR